MERRSKGSDSFDSAALIKQFGWTRRSGIKGQLLDIEEAIFRLPEALEATITAIIETAELLLYVALAVGMLLILAEVNYGLGIIVKESGHIGYESAKLIDTVVDGFLSVIHHITSFFHIHWHPPYIHLEDHLIEFKSSNPKLICSELASYTAMFLVFPRMSWSPHVCPVLRYFTGTPIDVIITPLVGWASYDPAPEGNNCRPPKHLGICIFCEFYFLLRLVAYFLIFILVAGPSWPLLSDLIDITIHIVLLLLDILDEIAHWISRTIHKIRIAKKYVEKKL